MAAKFCLVDSSQGISQNTTLIFQLEKLHDLIGDLRVVLLAFELLMQSWNLVPCWSTDPSLMVVVFCSKWNNKQMENEVVLVPKPAVPAPSNLAPEPNQFQAVPVQELSVPVLILN